MTGNNSKIWYYSAIMILFFLFIFLAGYCLKEENLKNRHQAELMLESYQQLILLTLQSDLNYTGELSGVLLENGEIVNFEKTAEHVLNYPGTVFAGILSGTHLTHLYIRDEKKVRNPDTDITGMNYAYTLARLTKDLVVEGPVIQEGKEVFLMIQPFFSTDDKGRQIFAGEAVVGIDSAYVLNSFGLNNLTQAGYEYEMWIVDPLNGGKKIITASGGGIDFTKAIETKFELPTVWTLSVIPTEGWYSRLQFSVLLLCLFLIMLFFILFLYNLYQKKEILFKIRMEQKRDGEMELLNKESLLEILSCWTQDKNRPFALLYVVLENYDIFAQSGTALQKKELLEHINSCLKEYVKNEHIIARVGESHFVFAIKNISEPEELAHLQKGLAIELIYTGWFQNEKLFLTAECENCTFPRDGENAEKLLQKVIYKYFEKQLGI